MSFDARQKRSKSCRSQWSAIAKRISRGRSEKQVAAAIGGLGVLFAGTIVSSLPVGESSREKSDMLRELS